MDAAAFTEYRNLSWAFGKTFVFEDQVKRCSSVTACAKSACPFACLARLFALNACA
jgi:hypothetical protein